MDDDWKFFIVSIFVVAAIVASVFAAASIECNAKTQDMGFPHRYGVWSGCMIEVQENKWIPLDSYYYKQP